MDVLVVDRAGPRPVGREVVDWFGWVCAVGRPRSRSVDMVLKGALLLVMDRPVVNGAGKSSS